ncbi:MAG: tetratricopeptide repeat protein [Acidobacteriia bacterium]|nr:tetratricopeptide repeat protein [Terriglobia bacterium]
MRSSILTLFLLASSCGASFSAAQGETRAQFDAGRQAYEASEYPRAVQLLQQVLSGDPRNTDALLLLAKSYIELGQNDNAVNSAERAVALAPQSSLHHQWLGKAYGEKAEHAPWFSAISLAKKTRKEFEIAVQLDEGNFAARQDLIEFYCSAPGLVGGGVDKAAPHIARLLALDVSEGHYAKGNCRRQKKDFAAADAEFSKALESGAKAPDLIYDIGDYAVKQKQAERLLAVAEAGQKADPADPRGDYYRAVAFLLKNEKAAEAEQLLRSYLQRAPVRTAYPRPTQAHDWLGHALELQGRTAEALQEYRAAVQADARNKDARASVERLEKR